MIDKPLAFLQFPIHPLTIPIQVNSMNRQNFLLLELTPHRGKMNIALSLIRILLPNSLYWTSQIAAVLKMLLQKKQWNLT